MKRTIAVAAVALLVLANVGWAKQKGKTAGGGFGGFGPTLAFIDFSGLNDELTTADPPIKELGGLHWLIGGMGQAHIGRIVLGGAGWGGSQTVTSDSVTVRVDVAGGQFEAGYSVLALKNLVVIPMLGIGGSGYDVTVERNYYPNSFGEFLEGYGPTSSVAFTSFILTPQLVINVPIKFFGFQLRGGYQFTAGTPDWKFPNGGSLRTPPEVAPGHPFVGLNVIFGGYSS